MGMNLKPEAHLPCKVHEKKPGSILKILVINLRHDSSLEMKEMGTYESSHS